MLVLDLGDFLVDASEYEFDDDDSEPSLKEILSGDFKSPSSLNVGYATFGVFQLVGHGKQTNEKCGTFHKVVGCSRVELHEKAVFEKGKLVNYLGKGFFRPVFHSCDKPSCPICYERGWAVREAKSIEFRLLEASKRWGVAEHIIVGLPSKYWGLSYADLIDVLMKALRVRGIIGGVHIFHGFRYSVHRQWYWSPHFHVIGFILGGYGKCRGCPHCKKGCGGFVDRNYRMNEVDGVYCKVKGKRKSLYGTAWYQLHHGTVRTDKKRFRVARWFGVCSYRKLKIDKALRKEYDVLHKPKCPICGSDLVRHEYRGRQASIIAWFRMRRGFRDSVKGVFDKVSDWSELSEKRSY